METPEIKTNLYEEFHTKQNGTKLHFFIMPDKSIHVTEGERSVIIYDPIIGIHYYNVFTMGLEAAILFDKFMDNLLDFQQSNLHLFK